MTSNEPHNENMPNNVKFELNRLKKKIELNLFPQQNYLSGTRYKYTIYDHIMHTLYIIIMIKVEMEKVEVQFACNTFPT